MNKHTGFFEAAKQIAREHHSTPAYWFHCCKKKRMDTIKLEPGQLCPDCYIDQYGAFHPRTGGM